MKLMDGRHGRAMDLGRDKRRLELYKRWLTPFWKQTDTTTQLTISFTGDARCKERLKFGRKGGHPGDVQGRLTATTLSIPSCTGLPTK